VLVLAAEQDHDFAGNAVAENKVLYSECVPLDEHAQEVTLDSDECLKRIK